MECGFLRVADGPDRSCDRVRPLFAIGIDRRRHLPVSACRDARQTTRALPAFQADARRARPLMHTSGWPRQSGMGAIAGIWFNSMMLRVFHSCFEKSMLISEYILES
jgi:hypothetical protein